MNGPIFRLSSRSLNSLLWYSNYSSLKLIILGVLGLVLGFCTAVGIRRWDVFRCSLVKHSQGQPQHHKATPVFWWAYPSLATNSQCIAWACILHSGIIRIWLCFTATRTAIYSLWMDFWLNFTVKTTEAYSHAHFPSKTSARRFPCFPLYHLIKILFSMAPALCQVSLLKPTFTSISIAYRMPSLGWMSLVCSTTSIADIMMKLEIQNYCC